MLRHYPAASFPEAESLDAAEKVAQNNPFISSIRIYELKSI